MAVYGIATLTSLNAFTALFSHLLPRFGGELGEEGEMALMKLWNEDATGFVADKLVQQESTMRGFERNLRMR